MAKAYFIGGTPRVGKTTLTLDILKEQPMLAASTDAVRYMLRRVIDKEDQPGLFNLGKFTSNVPENRKRLVEHTDEVIALQNAESFIVWKSVLDFVKSNLEDGFSILVEGIAVLPKELADLDFDYSAVFLGNQSEEHLKTIVEYAHSHPNDWLGALEDETIDAFYKFNQKFSAYTEEQCKKFNQQYVEVIDMDFENSLSKAKHILLNE